MPWSSLQLAQEQPLGPHRTNPGSPGAVPERPARNGYSDPGAYRNGHTSAHGYTYPGAYRNGNAGTHGYANSGTYRNADISAY